ncbi:MAG: polyhydroxyalkanoate synthesis repressor PhaR, partial [Roseovarius confluentis]
SYTTHATSMVPDFLSASFEMLQQGQSQMMENMAKANPLASSFNQMPGMDSIRAQQEAFLKAMTGGGMPGMTGKAPEEGEPAKRAESDEGLDDIKKQLADLQDKLSKLSK